MHCRRRDTQSSGIYKNVSCSFTGLTGQSIYLHPDYTPMHTHYGPGYTLVWYTEYAFSGSSCHVLL